MTHVSCWTLLAAAAALPRLLTAQYVSVGAPPATNSQCASAPQTLSTGSLAQADSQSRAARVVLDCPVERAVALSNAFSRRAGEPYSVEMASIFQTASLTGEPLPKALEVASDPSASSAARVLSLGVVLRYLTPGATPSFAELQEATPGSACVLLVGTENPPAARSLPADYKDRIKETASTLERSGATPVPIRSAANCVMNRWRTELGLPVQVIAVSPSQLSLTHECGNRFRVRNQQAAPAALQYEVAGDPERKDLQLPGKPEGASYSKALIWADSRATVRLLFDGAVVQTAAGTGSKCQ
jgi:hypothetical protein